MDLCGLLAHFLGHDVLECSQFQFECVYSDGLDFDRLFTPGGSAIDNPAWPASH
jgi:hypothetical protein